MRRQSSVVHEEKDAGQHGGAADEMSGPGGEVQEAGWLSAWFLRCQKTWLIAMMMFPVFTLWCVMFGLGTV